MRNILVALVMLMSATTMTACTTTCYGIEPDNEKETLSPCPKGWKNGSTHKIKEDQYRNLEVG